MDLDFGFGHELKKHAKDDGSGLTRPLFGSWTGIETSGPYSIAMYEGWPSVPGGLGMSPSAPWRRRRFFYCFISQSLGTMLEFFDILKMVDN